MYILSILHYLGSPHSYCTLIFDLMRNLYIYNACVYIHSINSFQVIYFYGIPCAIEICNTGSSQRPNQTYI